MNPRSCYSWPRSVSSSLLGAGSPIERGVVTTSYSDTVCRSHEVLRMLDANVRDLTPDCPLGSFVARWMIANAAGIESIQPELSTRSLLIRPTNFPHQVHDVN